MKRCTTLLIACALALPALANAQSTIAWNAVGYGQTAQEAFSAMYQNARQQCGDSPAVVHDFETLLQGWNLSGFVTYGDTSCASPGGGNPITGPDRPGLVGP